MPSDAIQQARDALQGRRRELTDELRQIDRALKSLNGGRPASRKPKRSTAPKRAGTPRKGKRADQAVRIIGNNPGITVSELAKRMKLKAPNYLYRVLPDLEKEGRIAKDGQGYEVKA